MNMCVCVFISMVIICILFRFIHGESDRAGMTVFCW